MRSDAFRGERLTAAWPRARFRLGEVFRSSVNVSLSDPSIGMRGTRVSNLLSRRPRGSRIRKVGVEGKILNPLNRRPRELVIIRIPYPLDREQRERERERESTGKSAKRGSQML